MVCARCGKEYPDGSGNCPFCNAVNDAVSAGQAPASPSLQADPHITASAPIGRTEVTGKKVSGSVIAVFVIAALVVAGFFVYWFLPANRYSRYMESGIKSVSANDYLNASESFKKALEIYPQDMNAADALSAMYTEIIGRCYSSLDLGNYEEALEDARLANAIMDRSFLNEEDMDPDFNLYMVYSEWAYKEALSGNVDVSEEIIRRAEEEGISAKYVSQIRNDSKDGTAVFSIVKDLEAASKDAMEANSVQDHAAVFRILETYLDRLVSYVSDHGRRCPLTVTVDDKEINWSYSERYDAAQLTFKGSRQGVNDSAYCDTYFCSGITKGAPSYEFFSSKWKNGDPDGDFYEIDFNGDPSESGDSNCVILTGTVKEGLYDGDVDHRSRGNIYHMKFVMGKVVVLDTVDPNGEARNVIGYTDDRNYWLSYSDAQLESTFGIRALAE